MAERSSRRSHRRATRIARDLAAICVLAALASVLVRVFLMQAFSVPTGSMEQTIGTHERILVSKIGTIERGEVVVFRDPDDWLEPGEDVGPVRAALEWAGLAPSSSNDHLVKRVIGMPGDHLVYCDRAGRLEVNGDPLDEDSYLYPGDVPSQSPFDVTVPADAMWVMGDHRSVSGDSRCRVLDGSAFVALDLVTGRAVATVWPLEDVDPLGVPAAFDDVPEPEPAPAEPIVARPSICPGGAAL